MLQKNSPHSTSSALEKIGAVIVLFEWEWTQIEGLLTQVLKQVDQVCIVDNGDKKTNERSWPQGVHYLSLGKNYGIAAAQNIGAKFLASRACTAILLLDQDSRLPDHYVARLKRAWQHLASQSILIATLGSAYRDVKTQRLSDAIRYGYFGGIERISVEHYTDPIEVDYVISSGSLVALDAWEHLGGMDGRLFTYWVDVEWGLRAKHFGYRNFMVPNLILEHSIGKQVQTLFGRSRVIHDDFRQYYIVRNLLLLLRYSHLPIWVRLRSALAVFVKYLPGYVYASSRPWHTFKNLSQAIYDGIRNQGGDRK